MTKHRQTARKHRENETPQKRKQRLTQKSQRQRERIADESEEKYEDRLSDKRSRAAAALLIEDAEQTSQRRERNATNIRNRRRSMSPESARIEHYDVCQSMRALRYRRDKDNAEKHNNFCEKSIDTFQEDCAEKHKGSRLTEKDHLTCPYCGAWMFDEEREDYRPNVTRRDNSIKRFSWCCKMGRVKIPPLTPPPKALKDLLTGSDSQSKFFREFIRYFNCHLAFAAFNCQKPRVVARTHGPSVFKSYGAVYHTMGPLLSEEGETPQFAAIYFHDPKTELATRLLGSDAAEPRFEAIMSLLQNMLHDCNPLIKEWKTQLDHIRQNPQIENLRLVLSSKYRLVESHKGTYNTPNADSITAILPTERIVPQDKRNQSKHKPHFICAIRGGTDEVKTFSTSDPLCDALLYPLIRPYADLAWSPGYGGKRTKRAIRDGKTRRGKDIGAVSARDFYAHQLMFRTTGKRPFRHDLMITDGSEPREYFSTAHYGGRLFQQLIVDQAARIDDQRLAFIRFNQPQLRTEEYVPLADALRDDDLKNAGILKVLPSSHTGSPRYRNQLLQDAACRVVKIGPPAFFITVTCNSKWEEIRTAVAVLPGQTAYDRPDIVARVFRIKQQAFVHALLEDDVLGKMDSYLSAGEYQQRMWPHSHNLFTPCRADTPHCAEDYDRYVCAEIPPPKTRKLRELVLQFMIHRPCGVHNPEAPCMKNGKCIKFFPKKFCNKTREAEDSYPEYRRRSPADGGHTALKNPGEDGEILIDNSWVVPYNPALLLMMECHINIECVKSIGVFKYLLGYVEKGTDVTAYAWVKDDDGNWSRGIDRENTDIAGNVEVHERKHDAPLERKDDTLPDIFEGEPMDVANVAHAQSDVSVPVVSDGDTKEQKQIDEIQAYQQARVISPVEGFCKIVGFAQHHAQPAVERLPVHLENQQLITFDADNKDNAAQALADGKITKLTAWMTLNETETDEEWDSFRTTIMGERYGPRARDLTYDDIVRCYTWNNSGSYWRRRKQAQKYPSVGRMYTVHPNAGELYYLRRLLHFARGCTSYANLLKFKDNNFDQDPAETYHDVCARMGLLQDDQEWTLCMSEAAHGTASATQLQRLFCSILKHCHPQKPKLLWIKFKRPMCQDVLQERRRVAHDPKLELDEDMETVVLQRLDNIIRSFTHGDTLHSLSGLKVEESEEEIGVDYFHEVYAAKSYSNKKEDLMKRFVQSLETMTRQQKNLNEFALTQAFAHAEGKDCQSMFVQAAGGTGKTFTLIAIINYLRSEGKIVLPIASSGLASLNLPDGRTAHSRLKIPLEVNTTSMCYIKRKDDATLELLRQTDLILWDEATMSDRYVIETVDRTLRDVLKIDKPFGGIPILFSGDWQQTLPIVVRGSRFQIVNKCLKASYLWSSFKIFELTENMRITRRRATDSDESIKAAKEFGDFLQRIGHGTETIYFERGEAVVRIPDACVSKARTRGEFIAEIYPDLENKISTPGYLEGRAILTPKNVPADQINADVRGQDNLTRFLSADKCGDDDDGSRFPEEVLNACLPSGMPPHELFLQRGSPIILLRNLDISIGACNGTRLIIKALSKHIITATIMTGEHTGTTIFIPRLNMTTSNDLYAFELTRRQFPVRMAFAMTISKSQGQTFKKVGIYFPEPPFGHGQLYVSLSRVGAMEDISVFIENTDNPAHCMNTPEGTFVKNVVYKEIFQETLYDS